MSEDFMISKNFVMAVSLTALFQVSLIGCGQKSSTNKVTTTRGKKQDPGTGGGTGPEAETSKLKIVTDPDALKQILVKNKCEAYYERVQKEGWEITISTNGNNSMDSVAYMIPKGSQLRNPVLVLSNPRSELSVEDSNKILEVAQKNKFDPIYFDVPGFGCSDRLPNLSSTVSEADLQKFSSQSVASLIEKNRSVILKNDKWKIWANGNASLIALRLLEKYPDTIQSLHLADFVFSDQPVELMKKRMIKQTESWEAFKAFAKEKDLEITAELMEKVSKTLDKQTCSTSQKICRQSLLSVLVTFLSQDDSKWADAVEAIKRLSKGQFPEILNQRALLMQKNYLYDQLVKATNLDGDSTLSACEKALKDVEVIEALKESPINSCQLEAALKDDDKKSLETKVKYKKLDYDLIQKNLLDKNISLHLAIGERSVMNPLSAVEDMSRLIGENLIKENLHQPTDGSYLFMNENLLKSLKK